MAFPQDLVERWKGLPYKTRKNLRLAAVGATVLGMAFLVVNATRGNLNKGRPESIKENTSVLLAPPSNLRAQDLANQIRELDQQVAKLQDSVKFSSGLTEGQIAAYIKDHPLAAASGAAPAMPGSAPTAALSPADTARMEAMQAQIAAMQAQIAAKGQAQSSVPGLPAAPAAPTAPSIYEIGGQGVSGGGSLTPAGEGAVPPPPTPGSSIPAIPNAPKPPQTITHIDAAAPKGVMQGLGRLGGQPEEQGSLDATVGVNDKSRVYLPAGTIITGVTLNGVNVGTGPSAMSNPQIVEVRIKKPAIMPNGYRVNLNNCMIINTGYGSLSSERVYLRPTTLSCVNEQGKVIESSIKGYVVGDDGISGVKGVVVDHQGALLAKGFFAGLFSGLGGAFSPQAVTPLQVNPGTTTQYQYPSPSMLAGSAISGGINNAAGQIAKFYIDEAKALQPTLQVNPGVSVDLILETGSYVQKKGMTRAELQKTAWESAAAANPSQTPTRQQAAQQQAQGALSGMSGAQPAQPAPTQE